MRTSRIKRRSTVAVLVYDFMSTRTRISGEIYHLRRYVYNGSALVQVIEHWKSYYQIRDSGCGEKDIN